VNPNAPASEFIEAVSTGLRHPHHAWSVLVIVLALAGGYLAARLVRRRVNARVARMTSAAATPGSAVDLLRFSIDGLRRLTMPVTALVLIWIGSIVLHATGVFSRPTDPRLLHEAANLIGAWAAIRFAMFVLRRVFRNLVLIAAFDRAIGLVVWGLVALHLTGVLDDVVAWLESTQIPAGHATVSLWNVLSAAVIVLVAVLSALWVGSTLEARLRAIDSLDLSVRVVLGRTLRAVLIVTAVLVGLEFAGIDLTILSVFGGALGVGLGLGLQRIASNYVSGFIILLDRSLRIGDSITVGTFSGAVTQINTRYTVLNAGDGTEAIVPNEMLVSSPVVNKSLTDRKVRVAVKVTVALDTDLERAIAILEESPRGNPRALTDPVPGALVTGLGTQGIDLELGFWVGDAGDGGSVYSAVVRSVLAEFRRAGIRISMPQREIRMLQAPGAVGSPDPAAAAVAVSPAAPQPAVLTAK
jgi:small-conductance mechanosensitive channel